MAKGKVFLDHSQPMKDQKTHISKDSGGDIWRITWGLIRIFFLWQSFFLPTPPHLTSRIKWYSFLLVVQLVDNLPAMQETWVQSLEKEMATYSCILAWRIPETEEPGRLQPLGSQRVRHDWIDLAWVPLRDGDSLQGGLSRPVSRWLSVSYPAPHSVT